MSNSCVEKIVRNEKEIKSSEEIGDAEVVFIKILSSLILISLLFVPVYAFGELLLERMIFDDWVLKYENGFSSYFYLLITKLIPFIAMIIYICIIGVMSESHRIQTSEKQNTKKKMLLINTILITMLFVTGLLLSILLSNSRERFTYRYDFVGICNELLSRTSKLDVIDSKTAGYASKFSCDWVESSYQKKYSEYLNRKKLDE